MITSKTIRKNNRARSAARLETLALRAWSGKPTGRKCCDPEGSPSPECQVKIQEMLARYYLLFSTQDSGNPLGRSALFVAERNHRVYARGAARRDVAGQ